MDIRQMEKIHGTIYGQQTNPYGKTVNKSIHMCIHIINYKH